MLLGAALCGCGPSGRDDRPCASCVDPSPAEWSQTAGPAGSDRATAIFASGDSLVLAGLGETLRSGDRGRTWSTASGLPAGRISSLSAAGENLFALVDPSLLFRSRDGGSSWSAVAAPGSVLSLAAADGRLLALTRTEEGRSVVASADGGASWATLAPVGGAAARVFAVGRSLFVSDPSGPTLLRSDDRGASWRVEAADDRGRAEAMAFHGGAFFALSQAAGQIVRWADGIPNVEAMPLPGTGAAYGASWLAETSVGLFAAVGAGKVLRLNEASGSWQEATDGLGPGLVAAFHGSEAGLFAVVEDRLLRFVPEAARWEEVPGHLVRTRIEHLATDGSTLAALDAHGRLHLSGDGGGSWHRAEPLTQAAPEISAVALLPGGELLAGSRADGPFTSPDGSAWQASGEGWPWYYGSAGLQAREVGAFVVDASGIWAAAGYGIERLDAPGNPWSLGGAGVYRSGNGGASWSPAAEGLPVVGRNLYGDDVLDPVEQIARAGERLFASTATSGLFRWEDGWVHVGAGLPPSSSAAPDPVVELAGSRERVWARVEVGGASGLFVSRDGGLSFQSTAGPTSGARAAALAMVRGRPVVAFRERLGGDLGIWTSADGGATWAPFGAGGPTASSAALAETDSFLFAATGGAGVWRLPLPW